MSDEVAVIEKNQGIPEEERKVVEEEDTALTQAIIRQIEYYFSDANIFRDGFLQEQMKKNDGWVPLSVIMTFKRMTSLTNDMAVVAAAINKSSAGLVKVSEDMKAIRRNPDMPIPVLTDALRKEILARTIYARGFGLDTTLDDILSFFSQYNFVENISMRQFRDYETKQLIFKGSVFVTFKTKEQAIRFLAKKEVKFGDKVLLTLSREEYDQRKREQMAIIEQELDEDESDHLVTLPGGTVLSFSQVPTTVRRRQDIKDALPAYGNDVGHIDFKAGDTKGMIRFKSFNSAVNALACMTDNKCKIHGVDVPFKLVEGDEEQEYLINAAIEIEKRRKLSKYFKGKKRGQDSNDEAVPAKKAKIGN